MRVQITEEILLEAVKKSLTISEVLRNLGYEKLGSGHFKFIKNKLKFFNIDTSHLLGRFLIRETKIETKQKYSDEELFVKNSPCTVRRRRLLQFLEKNKVQYCCKNCNIRDWNDKPLTLHVDHIDGNIFNNLLSNLRYLCPNCHQQTDMWGSKNGKIGSKRKRKYGDRNMACKTKRKLWDIEQTKLITAVLNSGIDFKKFGWVNKVAVVINQKPQKVCNWMKRIMPEFYTQCFKKQMPA